MNVISSRIKSITSTFNVSSVVMLALLALFFSMQISAQKSLAPTAAATLEQCRNGSTASPVGCVAPGGATGWVTGNAGNSNSHWAENEFISYRMLFSGFTPGATVHTLTLGYDVLQSGRHAIDYLGTFNVTETTADPCAGVTGCTLASPSSTVTIPTDTVTVTNNINPNTGLPVVQIPGQMTLWGGTFVDCPAAGIASIYYETYGGGDERQITMCFTASVSDPVMSWGGHVGWAGQWGVGNSAGGISGSPFHMRLIDIDGAGGNQDRSLSADAVVPSGAVFIKKVVNTLDGSGNAVFAFPFTATANFGLTSFSLIDDNSGPGADTQAGQPILSFGPGNTITVNEGTGPTGWTLADVNCVESGIQDSTKSPSLGPANIIVQLGEVVTCTFTNTQLVPSASNVTVAGRVLDQFGRPLSRVRVTLSDINGAARTVSTGSFGYYQFDEVESGQVYVISASGGRHIFQSQVLSVGDDIFGFDLIGN